MEEHSFRWNCPIRVNFEVDDDEIPSHLHLIKLGFPTKIVYTFPVSPIPTTWAGACTFRNPI
jgi:hypothetical protein